MVGLLVSRPLSSQCKVLQDSSACSPPHPNKAEDFWEKVRNFKENKQTDPTLLLDNHGTHYSHPTHHSR